MVGVKETYYSRSSRGAAGYEVGILVTDTHYPLLPGNVANAASYPFPVLIRVLKGVSSASVMAADRNIESHIIATANEMVDMGVGAVVGACGSFANYQEIVSEEVSVPCFMSVMLQIPLLLRGLKASEKIGVIVSQEAAVTPKVFSQCHIETPDRLVIRGARDLTQSQYLFSNDPKFDSRKMELELQAFALNMLKSEPDIALFLIQCSDFSPFSRPIQLATERPVFDMVSFISWLASCVNQRKY